MIFLNRQRPLEIFQKRQGPLNLLKIFQKLTTNSTSLVNTSRISLNCQRFVESLEMLEVSKYY